MLVLLALDERQTFALVYRGRTFSRPNAAQYVASRNQPSRAASRTPSVPILTACSSPCMENRGSALVASAITSWLVVNRGRVTYAMPAPQVALKRPITSAHVLRARTSLQVSAGVPIRGGRKDCAALQIVSPKIPISIACPACMHWMHEHSHILKNNWN
jgi:hypothetical protein